MKQNGDDLFCCESKAIWILKSFAILSVMAAHVTMKSSGGLLPEIFSKGWKLTINIGVMIFFVLSGYFYRFPEKNRLEFFRKKLSTVVIPWLFCGTLTWFVTAADAMLSHRAANNWLQWIIGYKTLYYYVAVLMFFYGAFSLFWRSDPLLWCAVGVTVFMRIAGTFRWSPFAQQWITPYQDAFNWCGFFAIGILLKRHGGMQLILRKPVQVAAAVFAVFTCVLSIYLNEFGTFNIIATVRGISFAILLWNLSWKLAETRLQRGLDVIGKDSYCIYLLHMPIVQPICFRLGESAFMHLVRPVIALGIMVILIDLGRKITAHLKHGQNIQRLFGLR